MTSLEPSRPTSKRAALVLVLAVLVAAVLAAIAVLGLLVRDVWQTSGAIAGSLLAAAMVAGALIPLPLAWLRAMRLFAGAVTAACGAMLTLMLGYAMEHPRASDPFLGGLMLAAIVAFTVTIVTDLRLQLLESRAARNAAAAAELQHQRRHEQLLAAVATRAAPAPPADTGSGRG
ncbi:MAG: hypothetical protein AAGC63_16110, partial [Propionicimonas sp.]